MSKRVVELSEREASMVLSAVAEMPGRGCPVCYALGYAIGYRRGCKWLAFGKFWERDQDHIAACILVRDRRRAPRPANRPAVESGRRPRARKGARS